MPTKTFHTRLTDAYRRRRIATFAAADSDNPIEAERDPKTGDLHIFTTWSGGTRVFPKETGDGGSTAMTATRMQKIVEKHRSLRNDA